MSELKAIESATAVIENVCLVYRKPEVDEVIEYLQNQLSLARTGLLNSLAKIQREAHHNKYKRCLAMASYWITVSYHCVDDNHRQSAQKHHHKWLELAEKFKE